MFFHSKKLIDCSQDEIAQLDQLTLKTEDGEASWMSDMIVLLKKGLEPKTIVFMAVDPRTNKIIAWSYVEDCNNEFLFQNKDGMPIFDFGVYVHPEYRRQGIAKQLVAETDKYFTQFNIYLRAYPHDEKSMGLFQGSISENKKWVMNEYVNAE